MTNFEQLKQMVNDNKINDVADFILCVVEWAENYDDIIEYLKEEIPESRF